MWLKGACNGFNGIAHFWDSAKPCHDFWTAHKMDRSRLQVPHYNAAVIAVSACMTPGVLNMVVNKVSLWSCQLETCLLLCCFYKLCHNLSYDWEQRVDLRMSQPSLWARNFILNNHCDSHFFFSCEKKLQYGIGNIKLPLLPPTWTVSLIFAQGRVTAWHSILSKYPVLFAKNKNKVAFYLLLTGFGSVISGHRG